MQSAPATPANAVFHTGHSTLEFRRSEEVDQFGSLQAYVKINSAVWRVVRTIEDIPADEKAQLEAGKPLSYWISHRIAGKLFESGWELTTEVEVDLVCEIAKKVADGVDFPKPFTMHGSDLAYGNRHARLLTEGDPHLGAFVAALVEAEARPHPDHKADEVVKFVYDTDVEFVVSCQDGVLKLNCKDQSCSLKVPKSADELPAQMKKKFHRDHDEEEADDQTRSALVAEYAINHFVQKSVYGLDLDVWEDARRLLGWLCYSVSNGRVPGRVIRFDVGRTLECDGFKMELPIYGASFHHIPAQWYELLTDSAPRQ